MLAIGVMSTKGGIDDGKESAIEGLGDDVPVANCRDGREGEEHGVPQMPDPDNIARPSETW